MTLLVRHQPFDTNRAALHWTMSDLAINSAFHQVLHYLQNRFSSLIARRWVRLKTHDGPDVKLYSVGWRLMPICSWANKAQLGVFFSSDFL